MVGMQKVKLELTVGQPNNGLWEVIDFYNWPSMTYLSLQWTFEVCLVTDQLWRHLGLGRTGMSMLQHCLLESGQTMGARLPSIVMSNSCDLNMR